MIGASAPTPRPRQEAEPRAAKTPQQPSLPHPYATSSAPDRHHAALRVLRQDVVGGSVYEHRHPLPLC